MKKILISKKALHLSLLFGLLCAIFSSFAHFNAACDDLRANVLRLHIIANSDSALDQEVKLKIRDRLLQESTTLFSGADSVENAIFIANTKKDTVREIANSVLKENNFPYEAKVSVEKHYFNTRVYENFTLPAGIYDSLVITLGKAEGKNWWCVIFPEVCIPAAKATSLEVSATKESCKIAYSPKRYVMKVWSVEKYEDLKNLIKK